jgi:hypothetical protein
MVVMLMHIYNLLVVSMLLRKSTNSVEFRRNCMIIIFLIRLVVGIECYKSGSGLHIPFAKFTIGKKCF